MGFVVGVLSALSVSSVSSVIPHTTESRILRISRIFVSESRITRMTLIARIRYLLEIVGLGISVLYAGRLDAEVLSAFIRVIRVIRDSGGCADFILNCGERGVRGFLFLNHGLHG